MSLASSDEVGRNVAKDHLAVGADAIEGAETDQPIAAADVEDDVARPECGAVEDFIASLLKVLDELRWKVDSALAALANPERPAVFRRAPTLPSPRGGGEIRLYRCDATVSAAAASAARPRLARSMLSLPSSRIRRTGPGTLSAARY
jgi:hypothetical protein